MFYPDERRGRSQEWKRSAEAEMQINLKIEASEKKTFGGKGETLNFLCTFAPAFEKKDSDGGIAQLVRAHDS